MRFLPFDITQQEMWTVPHKDSDLTANRSQQMCSI